MTVLEQLNGKYLTVTLTHTRIVLTFAHVHLTVSLNFFFVFHI